MNITKTVHHEFPLSTLLLAWSKGRNCMQIEQKGNKKTVPQGLEKF